MKPPISLRIRVYVSKDFILQQAIALTRVVPRQTETSIYTANAQVSKTTKN